MLRKGMILSKRKQEVMYGMDDFVGMTSINNPLFSGTSPAAGPLRQCTQRQAGR
mgnify:CR=1 FL=1